MLHTTFQRAEEAGACRKRYRKFARFKGGVEKWGKDTPIPLSEVLEVCGLDDAIWALRIVIEPAEREIRLFACDCAERVLPILGAKYPQEKRPRQAIETARKFARGEATSDELRVARVAAAWSAAARRAADAVDAVAEVVGTTEQQWQKQRFIQLLEAVSTKKEEE